MTHNIYIYILIMGGISYFIRVLPMTLIRKPLTDLLKHHSSEGSF